MTIPISHHYSVYFQWLTISAPAILRLIIFVGGVSARILNDGQSCQRWNQLAYLGGINSGNIALARSRRH